MVKNYCRCSTSILPVWQCLFPEVWSKCLLLNWVTLHSVSRFCKVFQKHQSYIWLKSFRSKDKTFFKTRKKMRYLVLLRTTEKDILLYWYFHTFFKEGFYVYHSPIFLNCCHLVLSVLFPSVSGCWPCLS